MNATAVCAVVLAGGQSSRMGVNKALLDIGGRPLIRIVTERILPVTTQIYISSNDPSAYRFLDFPVIPDVFSGCGPLAGFQAAMSRRLSTLYVMLACDLPNLQSALLANLVTLCEGYDAVIPRTPDGISHPLCAVYRQTCLPSIERALRRRANKVIRTFLGEELAVRFAGPEEARFTETDLANINTPEDLRKIRSDFCTNPKM